MSLENLETPSAEDLFRLVDDKAGGWLQTTKRRLKFRLRYHLCQVQLQQIRNFFAQNGIGFINSQQLSVVLRPMRPYLWRGLGVSGRAQALLAHFDWLLKRYSPEAIQSFYTCNGYELFSQTYPEGVIRVVLLPGRALGREGEMELHLKFNDSSVMRSAISVLPAQLMGLATDGFVMVIGNMQGSKAVNQEIKIVTQKLERTRPQNILMTALQGLASGWGLVGMLGVSDAAHVYSGYRSLSKRVGQNYDGLWEETGTTGAFSKTHWNLPIQWIPRS